MGILFLTAMAAGAVVMPKAATAREYWFTYDDYPVDELRAGRNGSVYFKTIINPSGLVDACIIELSTLGSRDKAAICALVKKRFKYRNVSGPDGAPSYFVEENSYFYSMPGSSSGTPMKPGPDFAIDVQALPKALKGKFEVRVNVAVDAAGKLQACDAPGDAAQPALAKLACGQLPAIWAPMPEKNAAGEAIAYIRQMRVEFHEASALAR